MSDADVNPDHRSLLVRWLAVSVLAALLMLSGLALTRAALASDLFTSLETPPSPAEIETALAAGVKNFDFDLDATGAAQAVARLRQAGVTISAYHVGGGGGRAWGSVKTEEWVRRYDSPRDFLALTEDVKRLVALGATHIHFDNTHRMSGRRLESIAAAIVAGGAGFIAKNNASKWNLVMQRRPDLRPAYAIIEDAMFDADETQAAYELHARGLTVYIVGLRKPIEAKSPPVTDAYATAYARANAWAKVLLMDDERAFDSRTGVFVK